MSHAFKTIGKNVKWFERTVFVRPETISFEDDIQVDDFVLINGGQETLIQHNVHIASFTTVIGGGRCVIKPFAGLSAGCRIITGSDDFSGQSLTNPTVPKDYKILNLGTIEIGRHALIGSNSVILPNVIIGEGTIVSAGAIVSRNLDPWSIYVGYNPKKVGQRDKSRILALELKYYKSSANKLYIDKHQERITEIEEILLIISKGI